MVMAEAAGAVDPIFDEVVGQGDGDWMFYRQPNGWITSGQIGKGNARKHTYRDQGWTPLDDYGRFDLMPYYADHPFEVLFARGGAAEMPVEQVMAMGWHLHPPLAPRCASQLGAEHKAKARRANHYELCWRNARPVVFPQLEGKAFATVEPCEFCDRTEFASDKVRSQHIRVLHKEEMAQIAAAREMAKGMKDAVIAAGVGNGRGTSLPSRLAFACGLCDSSFEKPKELTDHVKLCADGD